MTTWRDVKWRYEDQGIFAEVKGQVILVCSVPVGPDTDSIGRAIAHAWNVDLAAAQSWRELFGVDDSVRTRED